MASNIKWSLIEVKASEIKRNPNNPKIRNDKGFKRLQKSLEKFGKVFDGIVNKDMTLIDGHSRHELSRPDEILRLFIPSKQLSKKEYLEMNAIFDLAKAGDIDEQILESQFTEDFFEEWELRDKKVEAVEDDYEIPNEIETDIVLGDLFEIGEHRLLCGDSTDAEQVNKLMNGQKADMVFTDPPYGVDYKGINNDKRSGLEQLLNSAFLNYLNNSKNGASVYCFHSDRCSDIFNNVFRNFCHFSSMVIWQKESIVLSRTDYQSKHEPCFYGWFNNGTHKWHGDRKQESVWIAKSKKESGHTTPKPISIVSKAIANSSITNELVIDFFIGSGSTMVACEQLKRKCYGMELDPKYCQVILDRMRKLDPSLEVKKNGNPI